MNAKKQAPARAGKRKVLLVDDHPVLREGLTVRINRETDLTVCGEAAGAREARRAVARLHPDIVVVDLSLPDGHGLELIKNLRAHYADLLILVFSMHDESLYAERALRAGARGYVMKQEPPERLLAAIRSVLCGGFALSEKTSAELIGHFSKPRSSGAAPVIASLTDRELEIFQLVGRGVGTREISVQLGRSIKTVETHRARIMEKLHVKSAAVLVSRAAAWVATGQ